MNRESARRAGSIGALAAGGLLASSLLAAAAGKVELPAGRAGAGPAGVAAAGGGEAPGTGAGQTAGLTAFDTIQAVLQHPRCQNCHIPGDAPLQFDEGVVHAQNVQRGPAGQGMPGLPCATCHAAGNPPASYGPHTPPGAPNWHLPPPQQKMVFLGLAKADLCATIKDPKRNGGRDLAALLEHVSHDKLVLWGWAPGAGRAPVNVPHETFVASVKAWIAAGAPCPEQAAASPASPAPAAALVRLARLEPVAPTPSSASASAAPATPAAPAPPAPPATPATSATPATTACEKQAATAAAKPERFGEALYNAACCFALAGQSERALDLLGQSLRHGFHDAGVLESDPDLASLHAAPAWGSELAGVKANEAAYFRANNPELYQMYKQDQAERVNPAADGWQLIAAHDREHREKVRQMLAGHAVKSADDFFYAALIFQHGSTPDEYKLANELARKAAQLAPDFTAAKWLTAATRDRYLMSIGKPQIYGTQFRQIDGKWTQEPFDRGAVTDEQRRGLGVPSVAESAKQAAAMNAAPPAGGH